MKVATTSISIMYNNDSYYYKVCNNSNNNNKNNNNSNNNINTNNNSNNNIIVIITLTHSSVHPTSRIPWRSILYWDCYMVASTKPYTNANANASAKLVVMLILILKPIQTLYYTNTIIIQQY